ncbi:Uncharacterised protein [Mycobacteroides abscessus subsp. abscessus]|nr:Uncharacterised protein [Mycobacteroides abscessus subsp. abscessus]
MAAARSVADGRTARADQQDGEREYRDSCGDQARSLVVVVRDLCG